MFSEETTWLVLRPNPARCFFNCILKTMQNTYQIAISDAYFWKKRNDWVSQEPTRHPTSIGITYVHFLSMQSARCDLIRFFFCLVLFFVCFVFWWVFFFFFCLVFCFCSFVSSLFSSQGIVNSVRRTLFLESDHITMSGCLSIWMMCTGNYMLWSTENCKDVMIYRKL